MTIHCWGSEPVVMLFCSAYWNAATFFCSSTDLGADAVPSMSLFSIRPVLATVSSCVRRRGHLWRFDVLESQPNAVAICLRNCTFKRENTPFLFGNQIIRLSIKKNHEDIVTACNDVSGHPLLFVRLPYASNSSVVPLSTLRNGQRTA